MKKTKKKRRQIALKSTADEEDKGEGLDKSKMDDLVTLMGKSNASKIFEELKK